MRFEGRELKPYSEPVVAGELREGSVYFSVTFVDDDMHIPIMEPLIFIGRNLDAGDIRQVYFQDIDSYRRQVRYDAANDDTHARFIRGSEQELGHIFEYENALDLLLVCSVRRRNLEGNGRDR